MRLKNKRLSAKTLKALISMARPARFEHAAYGLEVRCSIQLSYGRKQKGLLSLFFNDVHKKVQFQFFQEHILLLR